MNASGSIYYNPLDVLKLLRDFWRKKVISPRDIAPLLFNFAYKSGFCPIHYDEKSKLFILSRKKSDLYCYYLTLLLILSLVIGMVFNQIKDFISKSFQIKEIDDSVSLFQTSCLFFTLNLHLHTFFKSVDVVQLINGCFIYTKNNESHLNKTEMKIIQGLIYQTFCMWIMASLLYTFNCNYHFLAPVLPVCEVRKVEGVIFYSFKPFPYNVFYMFLQIFMTNMTNCAMFPYVGTGIILFFDGVEMIKSVGTGRSNAKSFAPDSNFVDFWLNQYRACQVLGKQINNTIGLFFLPMHLFQLRFLAILATYMLIRLKLGVGFTIGILALDALIFFYMSLWKKGCVFRKSTQKAIAQQKRIDLSDYRKRVYKSCKPISINIGPFHDLTGKFILSTVKIVIKLTVSLLLMSKKSSRK